MRGVDKHGQKVTLEAGEEHLVFLVPIVVEDLPHQRAPQQLGVSVFDLNQEDAEASGQTPRPSGGFTPCVLLFDEKFSLNALPRIITRYSLRQNSLREFLEM